MKLFAAALALTVAFTGLVAPSTAHAEQSNDGQVASAGGCSSNPDMPSPWLGVGLICLGGVLRRR